VNVSLARANRRLWPERRFDAIVAGVVVVLQVAFTALASHH
jgi:hypothetical protein